VAGAGSFTGSGTGSAISTDQVCRVSHHHHHPQTSCRPSVS
jgi:hypothetical protein